MDQKWTKHHLYRPILIPTAEIIIEKFTSATIISGQRNTSATPSVANRSGCRLLPTFIYKRCFINKTQEKPLIVYYINQR